MSSTLQTETDKAFPEKTTTSKPVRKKSIIRRLLKAGLVTLLVLAVSGFAWDQIGTQMFFANNPPPGEIVTVNDVDFHVLVRGERRAGVPVLVVEPGLGDGVLEWLHLVEECASYTQIVIADRRGRGFSSGLSSGSRTPCQNVEDLKGILDAKGIEPPYVLAGHSMGGLNVRVFQSMYPESVAGLVLIDALTYDHLGSDELSPMPFYVYPLTLIGKLGVHRLFGLRGYDLDLLPEENLDAILGQRSMGTYYTSMYNHISGLIEGQVELKELLASECDFPLTVISTNGIPGMPELRWYDGQKLFHGLSPTAKIINLKCHHSVQLVEREIVMSEIRAMTDRVSSQPSDALSSQ